MEVSHSQSSSWTYSRWYFPLCAVFALAIALFNWVVDPLQFYRRATLYAPVFSENQRYQKPGLAKHYAYEIAVVGDSHAENFSPRHIEQAFGVPAVNLAISGSTAREQYLIAQKAIESGKVRDLIWVLGRMPFRKPPAMVVHKWGEFPHHFYRESPRTHPTYLLSLDTLELSVDALRGAGHRELESLNMWHEDFEFSQQRMLMDWRRRMRIFGKLQSDPSRAYQPRVADIRDNANGNLAALIRAHPEVRFHLLFPPYSVLSYLIDDRMAPWMFKERLKYKQLVVQAVADLPNSEVYDFQVLPAITQRLENYKDLEHFRIEINDFMIDSVSAGEHRVDKALYGEVLETFAAQVEAYKRRVCSAESELRQLCPTVLPPAPGDVADPVTRVAPERDTGRRWTPLSGGPG